MLDPSMSQDCIEFDDSRLHKATIIRFNFYDERTTTALPKHTVIHDSLLWTAKFPLSML